LAGRKYLFELSPLSFDEFLRFKGKKTVLPKPGKIVSETTFGLIEPLWREYLEFGAFPEVVLAPNSEEKKRLLNEVFTSYFQKEVEQLADFRKTDLVRDLIILLAENIGNILNIQRLASELGVSRLTLEEWLSFLKATYLIDLLPPHSGRKRVAIRKAKKVYFVDWGLAGQIAAITPGARLENCIFHLLRLRGELAFYRKKSGAEIDFILDGKKAFEVKRRASKKDGQRLSRLAAELSLSSSALVWEKYSPVEGSLPGFYL
jgi:predicted AAA+ superfamily ATPase